MARAREEKVRKGERSLERRETRLGSLLIKNDLRVSFIYKNNKICKRNSEQKLCLRELRANIDNCGFKLI